MSKPLAIIVGVGDGLSASVAQVLAPDYDLILAARTKDKMNKVAADTGAEMRSLDASDPTAVADLFDSVQDIPRVVVYNPSFRVQGSIADLDPEDVRRAMEVTAFGAFLVGQQAARAMLKAEPIDGVRGTILFTGASAGVKGFPKSAPFAMGKFAQRGLAQSMARELHPNGIHVAWINIDGAIRNPGRDDGGKDSMLDPDEIAKAYAGLIRQDRTTWSNELTLRPWVETF